MGARACTALPHASQPVADGGPGRHDGMRRSQVVPRIGTVERLVAEREVGDDVALDRRFQQRPLEPGCIAQMAAIDAPRRIDAAATPARRRGTPRPARCPRPARVGSTATRTSPSGSSFSICSISDRLCSISLMRIQTRALTSPSVQHRHIEVQPIIRRIADRPARVEIAARCAADIAAGAEAACQFGRQDAGADRAVLQRRGLVVELHQRGKARAYLVDQRADAERRRPADRPRRRRARCSPSSGDGRSRRRHSAARVRAACRNAPA